MHIKNKSTYNECQSAGDPMVGFRLIHKETNHWIQKCIEGKLTFWMVRHCVLHLPWTSMFEKPEWASWPSCCTKLWSSLVAGICVIVLYDVAYWTWGPTNLINTPVFSSCQSWSKALQPTFEHFEAQTKIPHQVVEFQLQFENSYILFNKTPYEIANWNFLA